MGLNTQNSTNNFELSTDYRNSNDSGESDEWSTLKSMNSEKTVVSQGILYSKDIEDLEDMTVTEAHRYHEFMETREAEIVHSKDCAIGNWRL